MNKKENITGIVLAGGRGNRLGEEKGLCLFKDKPLVRYAIDILQPICSTILISANTFIESYEKFGYRVVKDEIEHIGPLGGILSCLKHTTTQHNLVLSCDTPFVDTNIFRYILTKIENFQVVAPAHETFLVEPLSAYYAANVIGNMENFIRKGDYKMMHFLKQVRFKSVAVDKQEPWFSELTFLNINTPEDMEKAKQIIKL